MDDVLIKLADEVLNDILPQEGDTICEKCGTNLSVSARIAKSPIWPFCGGNPDKHKPVGGERDDRASSYVPDEIPGGMTLENVGREPVTVYSYTEMNQLFESRGLSRSEKFSPTPGTDRDPAGVQNPKNYMDPYTLQNGIDLILRAQGAKAKDDEDKAWAERAFRPAETRVLTEEEAKTAYRAIQEREEAKRARRR